MFYIVMLLKVICIEYILILLHEIIHLVFSIFLKFKISFFHVIPFTIYKKNHKIKISVTSKYKSGFTGRLHFNSCKLNSVSDYNILLKKLRKFLWVGPIFDFTIFIILFVLGIYLDNSLYLSITALLHLGVSSMTFFTSDGKYSIGSKEDNRIAYDLVSAFTLYGNGYVTNETKKVMTDKHLEISKGVDLKSFEVSDLWNFTNNISFYTNSLCSYINGDILSLCHKCDCFIDSLIIDFDKIKDLDYRQTPKTSILILLYYIYSKIRNNNFIPNSELVVKVLSGCNSLYFRNLYNYYFSNDYIEVSDCKSYLLNENKMPFFCQNCPGFNKILFELIKLRG